MDHGFSGVFAAVLVRTDGLKEVNNGTSKTHGSNKFVKHSSYCFQTVCKTNQNQVSEIPDIIPDTAQKMDLEITEVLDGDEVRHEVGIYGNKLRGERKEKQHGQ